MKQATNTQEVIERLDNMKEGTDQENAHNEADYLLCDALLILGHDDVVNAYLAAKHRVGFWYA
jgi:hypothetical protein